MLPEGTDELIERALREDIGACDHTTLATIGEEQRGGMRLLVKQPGVLAGVEVAQAVVALADPTLHMRTFLNDGALVKPGDVAFTLSGAVRSLLTTERVLLNFMQHLSGIATLTHRFVSAIAGTGCRVLDTRKTIPGLRALEKWAVRLGGGVNHRMGLYDMVMIKDNHADLAGGVTAAIRRVQAYLLARDLPLPIVVEVRNLRELDEAIAAGGIHRVLLDNFEPDLLREAVRRVNGRFETEASGGIDLDNARRFAETGVSYISVGALTHSAPSLDLSLKAL